MKKPLSILLVFILLTGGIFSQDIPKQPNPPRLVNDFAGLLNKQQISSLERKLVAFNDTNSTQIAVVIVKSLNGYDISDYAQRLAQDWGVGRKMYDNGVVIVLKPKVGNGKGEVNIEFGYGMEYIIPDILAKRIIDNEMIPHFKQNDYYGGLDAATDVIIDLTSGHFSVEEYRKHTKGGFIDGFKKFINFIGYDNIAIIIGVIFFLIMGIIFKDLIGGSSSGSEWDDFGYHNFSSGSGGFSSRSFGGSSGGSFGGFGGGSFGGGGASGSW